MIQILENLQTMSYEEVYRRVDKEVSSKVLYEITSANSTIEGIILDTRRINLDDMQWDDLRVISRVGVGTDNIDLEKCKERGIEVYTTPCDELTSSVAEFTVMQILKFLRSRGEILEGKQVGIYGCGRIGMRLYFMLHDFAILKVYDIKFEKRYWEKSIQGMLESDIICIHISGNEEVIAKREIEQMKDGVIIVNMARTGCVNTEIVYDAIRKDKVAGYITDVDDFPKNCGDIYHNKIMWTPHIASNTKQARRKMEEMAVENLIRGLKDESR